MDEHEKAALTSGARETPPRMDAGSMMACVACGRVIQAGDSFCRYCGKPQVQKKTKTKWYYEPIWILVLGFAVIGPLVLPLVIKSPKLGPGAKWGISIAVILYTLVTGYFGYVLIAIIWSYVSEFSAQVDSIYR
ncbi:MAG: hypothetical protein KJ052_06045 [Candidatus Hydrogenedentes bacterium]|nr:hypothetical protein [Candidatus Hydrogenedentota bacterium]